MHDVTQGNKLLHGQESVAFGDAGYQGIEKRADVDTDPESGSDSDIRWHIAMRPGKRKASNNQQ